jgi:hypothetical protein
MWRSVTKAEWAGGFFEISWRHKSLNLTSRPMILCWTGYSSGTPVRQFAGCWWRDRGRPVVTVSTRTKLCALFCMTFCNSRIVRTGKCFGLKQWQLLSTGNSFSFGFGGWAISLWSHFGRGSKCDKRGWGSIFSKIRATSLMNDPTLTELFWPHSICNAI